MSELHNPPSNAGPLYSQEFRDRIRLRPGMYFGNSGSAAIPELIQQLVAAVLLDCGVNSESRVEISFSMEPKPTFLLRFLGLEKIPNCVTQPATWMGGLRALESSLFIASIFCNRFVLSSSNTESTIELDITDQEEPKLKNLPGKKGSELTIYLNPCPPVFGVPQRHDLARLGGILRDLSVLYPGLNIVFHTPPHSIQAWHYHDGIRSFLQEMDYGRHPLHPHEIYITANHLDMKLDLAIRFVHAGTSHINSWVNFRPAQGGSYLEGLGDALTLAFPNPGRGCRVVRFITNPDTGAAIKLPHPFIAALHLQLAHPRFMGPTKDILMGDEVREFVREACKNEIKTQWESLYNMRI